MRRYAAMNEFTLDPKSGDLLLPYRISQAGCSGIRRLDGSSSAMRVRLYCDAGAAAILLLQSQVHASKEFTAVGQHLCRASCPRIIQTMPPFARNTCPLTHAPSGPVRNATTFAMSSGLPRRSSGDSFAS